MSERIVSLGELLSGMAHEMNTPVGIGVTGITHLKFLTNDLKDKYDSGVMTTEDFEKYLVSTSEITELVHSNLNKSAQIVKSFKQITASQMDEDKRTFNLEERISDALISINAMIDKCRLKIVIRTNFNEEITINSYPDAISQIVINLVINSISHGYDENMTGEIEIKCRKNKEKISITYKDDGKGIPENNVDRIFDPFFTTDRKSGSKGLGLSIIYNIITLQLKGSIICGSNIEKGVEFIIEFNSIDSNP